MEVSAQLHAPAALPIGKEPPPRYPLDRRLGGPQSRSGPVIYSRMVESL
jgi:hypothetical protein